MDLDPYVETLRAELDAAAAAGGPEVSDAAARLTRAVEPATRMVLLDALGDAASEVNLALSDRGRDLDALVSVDLRLRGRRPEFLVELVPTTSSSPPPAPAPPVPPVPPAPTGESDSPGAVEEGTVSRLTVRVADLLKSQVEGAAAREGVSVNAWITRVLADAVAGHRVGPGRDPEGPRADPGPRHPFGPQFPFGPGGAPGRRVQGWAR